ncbi:MAG: hypothetical protein AB1499_04675 [Nitrospirota bacterium]
MIQRINSLSALLFSFIFLLPSMSFGDLISWSSKNYTAYADVSMEYSGGLVYESVNGVPVPAEDSNLKSNTSLPLSASAHTEYCCLIAESTVSMTASNFNISLTTDADTVGYPPNYPFYPRPKEYIWGNADGYGEFIGSYWAGLDYFNLSYLSSGNGGSLLVSLYDTTDKAYLLNNTLNLKLNTTDNIEVYTPVGHNIQVKFKYSAGVSHGNDFSGSLSYNMMASSPPVAPEPISSILFIIGGTLLAGRRYLRRKK